MKTWLKKTPVETKDWGFSLMLAEDLRMPVQGIGKHSGSTAPASDHHQRTGPPHEPTTQRQA
jgi:hypothetical protein